MCVAVSEPRAQAARPLVSLGAIKIRNQADSANSHLLYLSCQEVLLLLLSHCCCCCCCLLLLLVRLLY
jgi:hypothetical protein